jgi:hypothetical protein
MSNLRSFCASRGGVDIAIVAGEDLAANDSVFIAATGGALTAGRAYRTSSDSDTTSKKAFVCGFVIAAVTTGNTGYVRVAGIMSGFSSLTAGGVYYTNSANGSIGTTAGTSSRMVGVAISTTQILINNRGSQSVVYSGTSGAYGYVLGGRTAASNTAVSSADQITFSTDSTAANTSAALSAVRNAGASLSKASTSGYMCGGTTGSVLAPVTTSDKLTYSNSTTAACTTANLATARSRTGGIGDGSTNGYVCGGFTLTAAVAVCEKLTFSNDTMGSCTSATLSGPRTYTGPCNGTSVKGYLLGGYSGTTYYATADLFDYSNDTITATTSANLTYSPSGPFALSDGSAKGYAIGGQTSSTPTATTTANKVTYSTDTTAAVTTANVSIRIGYGATSSEGNNKGYILGGQSLAASTVIQSQAELLLYATDTTGVKTTANLTITRHLSYGLSDVGW